MARAQGAEWLSRDPAERLAAILNPPADSPALNTDTFAAAIGMASSSCLVRNVVVCRSVRVLDEAGREHRAQDPSGADAAAADRGVRKHPGACRVHQDRAGTFPLGGPARVGAHVVLQPSVASPGAPSLGQRYGLRRVRAADLLVTCSDLHNDVFDEALAKNGVFGAIFVCTDLYSLCSDHVFQDGFFAFPFNNILHILVSRLLANALKPDATALIGELVAYRLIDKIVDTEEAARERPCVVDADEASCSDCCRVRPGHIGHLVEMANTIKAACEEVPALKSAAQASPQWAEFVEHNLAELNARNTAVCCLVQRLSRV